MRALHYAPYAAFLVGATSACAGERTNSGAAPAARVVVAKNAPASAAPPSAPAPAPYRCFQGPGVLFAVEVKDGAIRAVFYQNGLIALRGKQTDATHFSLRDARAATGEKAIVIDGEWSADGKAFTATLTDPNKSTPLSLRGSEGAFDKPQEKFHVAFKGQVGRTFVRMRLDRDGAELRGAYRYEQSAENITLAGSLVAANGAFVLTESIQGKATGKFEGVFVSIFGMLGKWSSPDGSKSHPVSMEPAYDHGFPEVIDLGGGLTLYPQEKVFESADCAADVLYPQVRGARDKAKESALNALLRGDRGRGDPCDQFEQDAEASGEGASFADDSYTLLTTKRGRFVGIAQGQTSNWKRAAHPNSSSTCKVIDTQTVMAFRLVDALTKPGRVTLGDMVTKSLQGSGPKLTEQQYSTDHVVIGPETNVCLGDDAIDVNFERSEIAPYFMGAPAVSFPKAKVRALFEKSERMDALFAQ